MRSDPATGNFLQNIYSVLVTLWLRIIGRSSEGFQLKNFPSQTFFNNFNHDYKATIMKKNSL